MSAKVAVVDLRISNLTSVVNAIRTIGAEVEIVHHPEQLSDFSHLILPGVGAFPTGMSNLRDAGMNEAVCQQAASGAWVLGLCLGMQLLASHSTEFGETEGLGLIPGRVERLKREPANLRLPHVGWNDVTARPDNHLLAGLPDGTSFYFVHSFGYDDPTAGHVAGVTEYGSEVVAVVEWGNVAGAQFHPEKSQGSGLAFLKNFVSRC